MRGALLLILLGATPACPGRHIAVGPGGVVASSRQIGWYRKKVITRQEPETLLAEDGTICRVSPDRFAATKIGAVVYCNWQ
jgi:hypothetical protein